MCMGAYIYSGVLLIEEEVLFWIWVDLWGGVSEATSKEKELKKKYIYIYFLDI